MRRVLALSFVVLSIGAAVIPAVAGAAPGPLTTCSSSISCL